MFWHVGEYMPLDPEHPTQGAAALGCVAFVGAALTGAALTGAIDKIVTAKLAMKGDEAFMAVSAQFRNGKFHPEALCAE
jgi:hypothetical protein